ncbi:MAG TPA: TIM-barrel domain-containing protein [Flavitalea sp.]|nr:TIM-barrel domain-containing protein [Flavitalea sp.]
MRNSIWLLLLSFSATAQRVDVNAIAKDPFNGKATEFVYTSKEGVYTFQSYGPAIVKTTFRPAGYTTFEQVSDAVIAKPQAVSGKVTAGLSYTIELGEQSKVVIQKDRLFYKSGNQIIIKNSKTEKLPEGNGFSFALDAGEQIFGGGERATSLNRRGSRMTLYNAPAYGYAYGAENLNFCVPLFISSRGYALFFDNPSRGLVDIGVTDTARFQAGFSSGELCYYVIFGKNIDEILKQYSQLTGRQPLPPRWALGNFVSRFGYRSEAQVKSVVAKMKDENFPMDAVILDLFWFGDSIRGTLGNLDWTNKTKWPDPKKMIADLKTQGLKTVLISEPYILEGTRLYNESQSNLATDKAGKPYRLTNFYFGSGGLLDVFKKTSGDFIWKQYKKQLENGVEGWWTDLGEPEKHPADMFHNLKDYGVSRPIAADEVHNAYGHYYSRMIYNRFQDESPGRRLFHLNRSGFAGSQRYSIFPWTGDVSRSWAGLKAQLPLLIGMSESGIPYIHSDAGGFTVPEAEDNELYTRWLQFAAFTPVFRPHATALEDLDPSLKSIPSEPAFYPDPFKGIVRKFINLRYRLLPYNYTLAYEQAMYGKPLIRPMNYYDFNNRDAQSATDQYYWGDAFIVAPITSKNATSVNVYLPEGKWYNIFSDSSYTGGSWQSVATDINSIPVFVKGGSFIPYWNPAGNLINTGYYKPEDVTVRYYPSQTPSSYNWFDDDGETSTSLAKEQYEVLNFQASPSNAGYMVTINTNNPNAYKKRAPRTFRLAIPSVAGQFLTVRVNGKEMKALPGNGEASILISFAGQPVNVEWVK